MYPAGSGGTLSSCAELKFDLDHVEQIGKKAQRKRNRNLGIFFGAVVIAISGLIGMAGFQMAASNAVKTSYDYYISQGDAVAEDNREQELLEKTEIYKQAVGLLPGQERRHIDIC